MEQESCYLDARPVFTAPPQYSLEPFCDQWATSPTAGDLCDLCRLVFSKSFFRSLHCESVEGNSLALHMNRWFRHGCCFCAFIPTITGRPQPFANDFVIISGSPVKPNRGLFIRINESNAKRTFSYDVRVATSADDPAAAYIPDRGFHDNPTNDAVTHQIKQWLKKCLVSHPDCGGMTKNHRFLPTRVIDVNRMQLHMSRPDETEPYTALSYCWGGAQVFKTTVKNFQVMVESIQLYSMPQTLQDAVHVTRQIGIRYLWVDCLCIIQDHPIDVALEIDKMHLIYKHSAVTIVAEDPHSVETGFLHPHLSEVNAMGGAIKIPFDCGGGTCGSAYLAPSNNAARVGGLRKRAWAFQETVLSPRLLVYSTQGIVWSCFSEHVNLPNFSRWRSQAPNDLCSQRQKSRAAVKDVNLTSAMLRTDGLRRHLWSGVLTEYQPLEISLAEDRLPALAGIAKHYQEAFGGKYVAGMWEEDLILQLGWQCNGKAVTAPTEASDAAQRPTWSWVSIYGPIKFPNLDTLYEETSQARVISCEVEPRASEAPFGQVKSAILELDAYNLPLFDAACFNRSDVVYDRPDSRPRDLCAQYRCLVLGLRVDPQNTHSTPKILEGLCVNSISDGLYQRIGFVSSPFREFGVWRADRPGRPVSSVCWEDFLRTRARRHHWVIV